MNRTLPILCLTALGASAHSILLYNTIGNPYTFANANILGGNSIFNATYDEQCIDDVTFTQNVLVTLVGVQNVTFNNLQPSTAILRVFADSSGSPGNQIGVDATVPVAVTTFNDTVFGIWGQILKAGNLSIPFSAGTYWFGLQAVDANNWHMTAEGSYGNGKNRLMRDGSNGSGNYGSTNWINADGLPNDLNMCIEGEIVPEPISLVILSPSLLLLLRRRRTS